MEQGDKMLENARRLAHIAHAGQRDKGGAPYILHPEAVAACFEQPELKIVALLHDVLEDSAVTPAELRQAGIRDPLVEAVIALTKQPGERYEAYLGRVKQNSLARQVKQADLRHNMDESRLMMVDGAALARREKYCRALAYLTEE